MIEIQDDYSAKFIQLISKSPQKNNFYPVSVEQETMWLDNSAFSDDAKDALIQMMSFEVIGDVDFKKIQATFVKFIFVNPALRSVFKVINDILVQEEQDISSISDKYGQEVDLSGMSINEMDNFINNSFKKKINVEEKVCDFTLFRCEGDTYRFIIYVHHIVSDHTVLLKTFEQFFILYDGVNNASSLKNLQPKARNYKNVLDRRDKQAYDKESKKLWQSSFSDEIENIEMDQDFSHPKDVSGYGEVIISKIDSSQSDKLKKFAKKNRLTPFIVLSSVFQILLHKLSQSEKIPLFINYSIRDKETKDELGYFINSLPVIATINDEETFLNFINQMKNIHKQVSKLRNYPYAYVNQLLNYDRAAPVHPLQRFTTTYTHTKEFTKQFSDVRFRYKHIRPKGNAGNDLVLVFVDNGETISAELNYNKDIYKASRAEEVLKKFFVLIKNLLQEPDTLIKDLCILNEKEKTELLFDFNQTQIPYEKNKGVHCLFEEQAGLTPACIALVYENYSLTYKELNERSNQLAHYLIQNEIVEGDLVGLYIERSLEMVIGILAILKAGAAYVPLDTSAPSERIRYMLESSNTKIILTQESIVKHLEKTHDQVVCLDTIDLKLYSQHNPDIGTDANSLAYVIFTSGTTGLPKGIMLEHKVLLNLMLGNNKDFENSKSKVVLQFASINFDVSIQEIFTTLTQGLTLHIINKDRHKDMPSLAQYIVEHKINRLFLPYIVIEHLVDAFLSLDNTNLQEIITAGEQLKISPEIKEFFLRSQGCKLINHYGPSETHVVSSFILDEDSENWEELPPIGKPISNTQLYILDRWNNLLPKGVPGELYVSGDGLSRGYLGNDALNEDKFIANPFKPNTKMYKTGDLVAYLENGNIKYLGRIDEQVKIRGFRVEVGEVEQKLLEIKGIRKSAVLVKEEALNEKVLVAYIVTDNLDVDGIKLKLSQSLPEYMIPTRIVIVDDLPQTPNKKVDKKALAKIKVNTKATTHYIAPKTAMQKELASLFSETLKRDKIGLNDNFFHLGGHSLLATKLISKIRKTLEIELSIKELFLYPTVAGLQSYVSKTLEKSSLAQIPIIKNREFMELSFAQERLWFLDQFEEEKGIAYFIPGLFHLQGDLNQELLESALNTIVNRHEVLRSNIIKRNEELGLSIKDIDSFSLEVFDVIEIEMQKEIDATLSSPFDLSKDNLFKIKLFNIDETSRYLFITMHHIVSDGWSIGVLIKELSKLYNDMYEGEKKSLPPLPIQYSDYAAWQKKYLYGKRLEEQLLYWKKELNNTKNLGLPTSYTRPLVQSYNGKTLSFEINENITSQLHKISKEQGVSLFMTLLGCFSVLLHRYSQQDDVVIGTPVANRNSFEQENLIGLFVNTIVLRQDYSKNPSFKELLQGIKENTLNAYKCQDVPFEKVVETLNIPRDTSRMPLFQVMLILHNNDVDALKLSGLEVSSIALENKISKFDLSLHIEEIDKGLKASFEYATDLFSQDYIEDMIENFNILLESICLDIDEVISQYRLVSKKEEYQQLEEYNPIQKVFKKEQTIHQRFEEQVGKFPNKIAVVYQDKELSYTSLNEKANALAHYLIKQGLHADELVAICVERSIDMIIGLLAILKAGAAYVPIDSSYPYERIQYILNDSKSRFILSEEKIKEKLGNIDSKIICLDSLDSSKFKKTNPKTLTQVNNLAYVIYTSGTTGQPKGVMIEHSNVERLFKATQKEFNFDENDIWTVFHSFAFDFAVWEIWGALLFGGKLIVVSYEASRNVEAFYKIVLTQKVTVLNQTPSSFKQFIDVDKEHKEKLSSLRIIVFGGDKLEFSSLKIWFDKYSDSSPVLINMYGITETTVHTTFHVLSVDDLDNQKSLIGRTLCDLSSCILDKNNQLLPKGVAGELHISGDGLARAYLNQERLTAEKFILNPFDSNAKMYKTGDLVRYTDDGNMEYLGRIDDQVKIRGFRIELGEIQQQLLKIKNIKEACVIVKDDKHNEKAIFAFIVNENEKQLNVKSIKDQLLKYLPEYMIPAFFTQVELLPLTSNGKIDKVALSKIQIVQASTQKYAPAKNELEKVLIDVFRDVLKVDKVGIYDDFFELGGHSLLATKLVSKIRKETFVELSLKEMFLYPNVEGLAKFINEHKARLEPERKIIRNLKTQYEEFPLSLVQQAFYIGRGGNIRLGDTAGFVYSEFESKELDLERFEQAWNQMIKRHEMLRCIFNENITQQVLEHVPYYKIERDSLENMTSVEANDFLDKKRIKKLEVINNPSNWPLVTIDAYRLPNNSLRLHIYIDALICDATSIGILFNDLYEFYTSAKKELAGIGIGFKEYTEFRLNNTQSDKYKKSLEYWKNRLETLPSGPELPLAINPDNLKEQKFSRREFSLDKNSWALFQKKASSYKMTPSVILLSLFSKVLATWSKSSHFCLTLTQNTRLPIHEDIDKVIGTFTSLILLEVDAHPTKNLEILSKEIQKQLLSDLDNAEVGGVEVLRELRSIGKESAMPVVFTSVLGMNDKGNTEWIGESKYQSFQTSQIWIDNAVVEKNGELKIVWSCLDELFELNVLDDMFAAYTKLIKMFVDDTMDMQGSDLSILPKYQMKQRRDYNDTKIDLNTENLVSQFMKKALSKPQNIAVVTAERSLNYQELHNASAQLAQYIETKNYPKNKHVALILAKGWEQVVGVMACGYAGVAYLPIDINTPKKRIQDILKTAEAELVFCTDEYANSLSLSTEIEVLNIASLLDFSKIMPEYDIQAGDKELAYTIFTSGSTGQPKGVMINHENVCNTVMDINQKFCLGESDKVFAISSLNFDLSVFDIYGTLSAGACLIVPREEERKDPKAWLKYLVEEKITVWNSVPAIAQLLCDEIKNQNVSLGDTLRLFLLSGDFIPMSLTHDIFNLSQHCEVISLGGATEGSIWSIYYPINNTDILKVPYGYPLANQEIYILDETQNVRPNFVHGDIYIKGKGVSQGYLNDKKRTSEQFLIDKNNQEIIYKTGDIGYFNAKGYVEIVGRADEQVKIQGYRVELGEIEQQLLLLDEIKECVVLVKEEAGGRKFLVAYLGLYEDADIKVIKTKLAEYLPEYMLPQSMVVLKSMPLTSNGKIDKKALAKLDVVNKLSNDFVNHRDEIEEKLVSIFKEVLSLIKVGVKDNFFELGGHSISAVSLMSKVNTLFETNLPLAVLFNSPTVETLGNLIKENNYVRKILVPIQTKGNKTTIVALPGIGGNTVVFHRLSKQLGDSQPFYGLDNFDDMNEGSLLKRYDMVAKRNVEAIKAAQLQGPYNLIAYSFSGVIAYEMARLLGDEVKSIIMLDVFWMKEKSYSRYLKTGKLTVKYLVKKVLKVMSKGVPFVDVKKRLLKYSHINKDMALEIASSFYFPRPITNGPEIVFFRIAKEDLDLEEYTEVWEEFLGDSFNKEIVQGDHLSMLREENIESLSLSITRYHNGIK